MTLLGARVPRICVIPDGDEHPRWQEALDLLDRVGMNLDPWQVDVLHASMLRRGAIWAAFTVGICAPRQNGKNEILQARELIGALILEERLQIHSAHLADTCIEAFMRWDDLIDGSPWLLDQVAHVRRTNGREAIEFTNGSRLRFRTRTRGGGRGFSGSPVIFDEPMFFPVISQNAILPVMSAQPDPQAWYTGSAVDKTEHSDGVVFARVRERALEGVDDRIAYFEWSLDAATPDLVEAADAGNPEKWAETNPALGIRITPEYVKAEREELTPRGFAVERLGVGDWPDPDAVDRVLSVEAWDDLERVLATIPTPYGLAFDVSPNRRTAVAVVGRTDAGDFRAKLLEFRDGTGWFVDWLVDFYTQRGDEIYAVACDGLGPAAPLASEAENAGIPVERFNSSELAEACGLLVDVVAEARIHHAGDAAVRDAIMGADTRPLLDRFAWARKSSKADIAPLVSTTVALGVAAGLSVGEMNIY